MVKPIYSIIDLLLHDEFIQKISEEKDIKKYRFNQFLKWIFNHCVFDINRMTDLDSKSKAYFQENINLLPLQVVKTLKEEETNTVKLLVKTNDNYLIEIVLLEDENKRKTLCLSSQIGCPMGCKFCATGKVGFSRNLTADEMLWEYLLTKSLFGEMDNIVIMGMGEPLLNFENLRNFINALVDNKIKPYSARRITISTSGIKNFSKKLIELNHSVKLSISLHSPFDNIRKELMPNSLPIAELLKECEKYRTITRKRITFEYILIDGITDDKKSIEELIKIAKKFSAFINFISYNEIDGINYKSSKREKEIIAEIEKSNINYSFRYKRGQKIKGACGQLVWERIKN